MKPIPYGRQNITRDDIEAVNEVLKSDYITQGPKIEEFENDFAAFIGAKYAVAVANGTAALHLSCLAIGIESGDTVLTAPITFVASANATLYAGGNIDLIDIDPNTWVMDLNHLEDKLKKSTTRYKAVVPIDFAGLPVDMEVIKDLGDKYGFKIIEDSCHAPGAEFEGKNEVLYKCGDGKLSDLSIFSFHPVKHVATGEGGMITTNDEVLYNKLLQLRTHGITKDPSMAAQHGGWYYEMQDLGYNYRLTDIQAALGISQLKRSLQNLIKRREIAAYYLENLSDLPVKFQEIPKGCQHAYHLFIICSERRRELYDFLRSHNILVQVHYVPVHYHPYYRKLGWKIGDFPNAEWYYERCLSLPIYPTLSRSEQDYIITKLKSFFEK